MRKLSMSALVLFVCSVFSIPAQTPDTASLSGQVEDTTHAVVAHATVSVTNQLTGLQRTTQTDDKGEFLLSGLPAAGSYVVEGHKNGFANAMLKSVTVAGGNAAKVTIILNVSPEK